MANRPRREKAQKKKLTAEEQFEKTCKERRQQRKQNMTGRVDIANESHGQFVKKIQQLFCVKQRKAMWSASTRSSDSDSERVTNQQNPLPALNTLARDFLKAGEVGILKASDALLTKLGKQDYSEGQCDGNYRGISILKSVKKETRVQYAGYLANFVATCFRLLDEERAKECGVVIKTETKNAIVGFQKKFEEDQSQIENLIDFLVDITGVEYALNESYNYDLFSAFAAVKLFDKRNGKFNSKESSSKCISAFKHSVRIAYLMKLAVSGADESILKRVTYDKDHTFTMKLLMMMQTGVNGIRRKQTAKAMISNPESKTVCIDGRSCSFDLLNDVLFNEIEKAKELLDELLMGFSPEAAPVSVGGGGFAHMRFEPNYVFGEVPECEFGNKALSSHVCNNEEFAVKFFGKRKKSIKKAPARKYLARCKQLEEHLVVIMHILIGCGVRATDYALLTFMNGDVEYEERHVSMFTKDLLHITLPNQKVSTITGKENDHSALLPREIADSLFVTYWKYVRPFAARLAEVRDMDNAERWRRNCFIRKCPKWAREQVFKAFGEGDSARTFQWLRHAAVFLFDNYVSPEGQLAKLPVHNLFGHSERTHRTYAVEQLAGSKSEYTTNVTDVKIMLSIYWRHLSIKERMQNPADAIESFDDNSSTCNDTELADSSSSDESSEESSCSSSEISEESSWKEREKDFDNSLEENVSSNSEETAHLEDSEDFESSEMENETSEVESHDLSCETGAEEIGPCRNHRSVQSKGNSLVQVDVQEDIDIEHCAIESTLEQEGNVDRTAVVTSQFESIALESGKKKDLFSHSTQQLSIEDKSEITDVDSISHALSQLGMKGFKSNAQRKLVEEVLIGKSSLLGVLPTGGGKSLAMFAGLHFKANKLTVAVFPLLAVLSDVKARLDELKQKGFLKPTMYRLWDDKAGHVNDLLETGTRLVLVSAEKATHTSFHTFLKEGRDRVAAVVFDEAPVFVSSAYRKNLALIPFQIRSATAAKFILLSATVPVDAEKQLLEGFGVPKAARIRMCSTKLNIGHVVKRFKSIEARDVAKYLVNSKECAVVFVKSVKKCEELANKLQRIQNLKSQVGFYHAQLDSETRYSAHHSWLSGSKRIMVATTAFAFGVDSASCNLVIHIDGSYNLETYCQGAGRAGRSGQQAKSITMLSSRPESNDKRLHEFYKNDGICRRTKLSKLLDTRSMVVETNCGCCDQCLVKKRCVSEVDTDILTKFHFEETSQTPKFERSEASRKMAESRQFFKSLETKLKRKEKCCFVCAVLDKNANRHGLKDCLYFKKNCFRCCRSGCNRRTCEVGLKWGDLCKSNAVCETCCTPCVSMVGSLHSSEENSLGGGCKYRDSVVPACLALWRHRNKEVKELIQKRDGLDCNFNHFMFARWACQVKFGISNANWLVAKYLRTRKLG